MSADKYHSELFMYSSNDGGFIEMALTDLLKEGRVILNRSSDRISPIVQFNKKVSSVKSPESFISPGFAMTSSEGKKIDSSMAGNFILGLYKDMSKDTPKDEIKVELNESNVESVERDINISLISAPENK